LVHTSVTYFYAFAQKRGISCTRHHSGGFFFYPKNFSKNILAILVEFPLEKNKTKNPQYFLLLKNDKFCEQKCSNLFFFLSFFWVGGWGEFWNLATTKKRKIVKYVYFVLHSLSFWGKNDLFLKNNATIQSFLAHR